MSDRTGLAEALLGLDGFRVLEVTESADELVIGIETDAAVVGCGHCGVRAESHGRMTVEIRDLACFGRPSRLVWNKRRWRCADVDCDARTWTERSLDFDAQAVLTRRAGAEACRQVGEEARPVARVAAELGVCWWTVMNAVIEHGTPLVDDPGRIGARRSTRGGRDLLPVRQPVSRHHLRHRLGRPAGQGAHRHRRGQHGR